MSWRPLSFPLSALLFAPPASSPRAPLMIYPAVSCLLWNPLGTNYYSAILAIYPSEINGTERDGDVHCRHTSTLAGENGGVHCWTRRRRKNKKMKKKIKGRRRRALLRWLCCCGQRRRQRATKRKLSFFFLIFPFFFFRGNQILGAD